MKELKNSSNTRENSFSLDSTSINSNPKRKVPFFITRKKLRIRSQSMQNSDLSLLHKSQNIVSQLNINPVYEDEEEYLEEKKPRIKRCSMLLDKKEDSLFKVKGRRTNESRPKSFDIKLPGVKEEDDEVYQGRQKRQLRKFKYFAQIDRLEKIENQQILIDSTKDFICGSSQQPIQEEKDEENEEDKDEDTFSVISKSSHSSFMYNFIISDVLDQIKLQKNNKISEIIQEADRADEEDDEDECSSQVVKDLKKKRNNFKQYLKSVTKSDLVCLDLIPENDEDKDKKFIVSEQIEEDTSNQLIM